MEPRGGQTGEGSRCRTVEVWRAASFLFLLLVCCMTRLYNLGWKAIMHDETLFVYYTYFQLFDGLDYHYLPILHGPTMMQLQAIVFHLFGASDYTMRLGVALLGVGGFFWVWALRPWLGQFGTWVALAFYALSPGITCFQRFYHMDSLYLFNALWIIASLAHWWRSRKPWWLVSAMAGSALLFSTKASSVFVFFSLFTFLLLLLLSDYLGWLLKGRDHARLEFERPGAPFPNPFLLTLLVGGFVVLVLTQVFEGIKYDGDVVDAIGHDWVLRDVRSIPLALGWEKLTPETAPDAGIAASPLLWRVFYGGLFGGLLLLFSAMRFCANRHIGFREFPLALWSRVHSARWHLVGVAGLGLFVYMFIFTTGLRFPLGPFETFSNTWSYWGGQHEWGRIGGPFHQHLLNLVVYEMPSVLTILAAWIGGLFCLRWSRFMAVSFFLIIEAVAGFHKLIFSGLQQLPSDAAVPIPLEIPILKHFVIGGALLGLVTLAFPKSGRVLCPLALGAAIVYAVTVFGSDAWGEALRTIVYRDDTAIMLKGRPVSLAEFMEIQFNFDGGSSIALVVVLVFFATVYTWKSLERGERFHAFLVWWLVTAAGAASYAREAVPQVGIHVMMPAILLAASHLNRLHGRLEAPQRRLVLYAALGVFLLWNAKASFNLNFRNADDVRERMVYGHTPQQVRQQARFIQEYRRIAPVRMEQGKIISWIVQNNQPTKEKQLRVGIQSDQVIWQLRWYLRNTEWVEEKDLSKLIEDNYEFIFAKDDEDKLNPQLAEKYHLFRSCAIRFWLPRPLESERLLNAWKLMIPGHYLDNTPQAGPAWDAKQEWRKVWRYLLLRETFDGGSATGGGTISSSQYIFCVRKDLY